MKSILLHIADDACLEARIEVALDLGRAFDAHVTLLQTLPDILAMPIDIHGTAAGEVIPAMQESGDKLRRENEKALRGEDVAWDWITTDGPADARILSLIDTYDLLVLGACDPFKSKRARSKLAEDLSVSAGVPVFIVPKDQRSFDCSAPALIAWDGSAEASRAMRAAIPLLRKAEMVYLVNVQENRSDRVHDLPATNGAQYLSRHGIASEIAEVHKNELDIAACINAAARAREAGLIVMGAYGHSRLRQNLLGGVTQDMLTDPGLPLVMYH